MSTNHSPALNFDTLHSAAPRRLLEKPEYVVAEMVIDFKMVPVGFFDVLSKL